MSVLLDLAYARMEVLRLEAHKCGDCSHPFKAHSIIHAILNPDRLPKSLGSCRGEFGGDICPCRGWQE